VTGFRASDEQLDREIEATERIARLRVRRYASELRSLEADLRELRKERARRRALAREMVEASASAPVGVGSEP
jgi:hypothetical protein